MIDWPQPATCRAPTFTYPQAPEGMRRCFSALHGLSLVSLAMLVVTQTSCSKQSQRNRVRPSAAVDRMGRCSGKTMAGQSGWQRYYSLGLFLDVDTTECGFDTTPIYLSSIGGNGLQWTVEGGTAIYFPTASGFRVYLRTDVSPEDAERFKWHVNWDAVPKGSTLDGQCTGQTEPGHTKWIQGDDSTVYTDVDTLNCGFEETPVYSTSVGGKVNHWVARGKTSIFIPTATGFRVHLHLPGITPELANQKQWHINWSAARRNIETPELCTGATEPSAWQPYSHQSYYVDVDTSQCGFASTPTYITSLYGTDHLLTHGSGAVYFATETGFRVYVGGVQEPNMSLNWKASATPADSSECLSGPCCSNGRFLLADHLCREADPSSTCDVPEYCTGVSAECPQDRYAPATQVCRAAADSCDEPESCTGTSPTCPPDTFAPAGQVCRQSLAGLGCDVEEKCSGNSPSCPPDTYAAATQVCRPKNPVNSCDVAELCSGASPVCPEDEPLATGVGLCRSDDMDIGLNTIGVPTYAIQFFGADAAEVNRVTSDKSEGTAAAQILSGRNGLTQSWGMGARFAFPSAMDLSDYGRVSYAVKSSVASANVKVALELLIDAGGPNESVWRQRPESQLRLSDISRAFTTVSVSTSRDAFERSDGAHSTTMDLTKVTGVQFLMLIEPNTPGSPRQVALNVDEIRFSEKWRLAGYTSNREATVVPPAVAAKISDFDVGSSSRLAVWVTDPSSAWLGIVQGMKAVGVPIRVTESLSEAIKHKAVLAYPSISSVAADRSALRSYVEEGGTLIAGEVNDESMKDVFGFDAVQFVASSDRFYNGKEISRIRFTASYPNLTAKLTDVRERNIPIYRSELNENMPTWRYNGTVKPGLALYADASDTASGVLDSNVAITYNEFGNGKAYAVGLNIGLYVLRSFGGFGGGLGRDYLNAFDPAVDVLLRLIRDMYLEAEDRAVTLSPLPNDRDLVVMLTHDIDTTESAINGMEYARIEREAGVTGTYFIQTKYVTDAQESAFRGIDAFKALTDLNALGMEVASHSVAHANNFNYFDLGTGNEQFQTYRPINIETPDGLEAVHGTILGELRVSRFLLEDFVPGVHVSSFRPGHLRRPLALPQSLYATGYRYGSISAAGESMTHLPHKMTYNLGTSSEVNIFDFPVTIEDELPESPIVTNRVVDAVRIADQIGSKGGIMVMLIHPNVLGSKLEFVRNFIEARKDKYLFSSVADFGSWWESRDRVEVGSDRHGEVLKVTLNAPRPISGLTLEIPEGLVVSSKSRDVAIAELPEKSRLVVQGEFSGELQIYLRTR